MEGEEMDASDSWLPTDLMGDTVISRRAPFKVYQASWNPKIDLLALASQKGEVSVRRLHWKHGWKRDVYEVKPLLLEGVKADNEIRFETMCWSPDGKILATAFSDGCIHLLDAEKGIVRFTVRMKTRVTLMRWQHVMGLKMITVNKDTLAGALSDLSECETVNDKSEEMNQLKAMKAFCDNTICSLLGTLLFILDADNIVHILVAGVLPIASIEPPIQFFGNCDPYSITVGDMYYWVENDQLLVVYSSMGQHIPTASPGMNTQVIGFDIDSLHHLKNGVLWTLAHRWPQLVFDVCFISEAFARATINWEEQSKEFTEKFNSFGKEDASDSNLGECFINMILTGHANQALVNFYRNVLKPTEWKKMTDWADKGFSDMIANISNELIPGAEALQHNMRQLLNETFCALESSKTKKLLRERLFNVDVYPYGEYADENEEEASLKELKSFQNLTDDIVNKISEMHLVATRNRKDLVSFMNWLSQTPLFTAKNKRSASEMKFDSQLVIEYIRQETIGRNENTVDGSEPTSSTVKNYSFDKVFQYFDRQNSLKFRLDVQSNSWDQLSEQHSTETLANSITKCFDALQSIQSIMLKNFSATASAQTSTLLEHSHAEGFEKFSIIPFRENPYHGLEKFAMILFRPNPNRDNYSYDEPYGISCIGVGGIRHIIYGTSGKVLYEMYYAKQPTEIVASCSGDVEQISPESSEKSGKMGAAKMSLDKSQKAEESVKGVDSAMPKSPTSAKLLRIEKPSTSPVSRRLMHFEWYGYGTFYGLLKICKGNKEETVLCRSSFDGTNYVHKDTSGCMESYCLFTVSFGRKLGVAFTENGFRIKWFKIKMESTSFNTMDMIEMPRDEKMFAENLGNEFICEDVQLRRSVRKRKSLKK